MISNLVLCPQNLRSIFHLNELLVFCLLICVASATFHLDTEESAVDSVVRRIQQDRRTYFRSRLNTLRQRDDDDAENKTDDVEADIPRTEVTPTKEPAPQFSFPVWDDKGKLCLLGKFGAFFTIDYQSRSGKQTTTEVMPTEVKTKGSCEDENGKAVLSLSWDPADFRLTMTFKKIKSSDSSSATECWVVSSIEVSYDLADESKFPDAKNPSKMTVHSMDGITFFETPLGKSYFCPSPDVIKLYDHNRRQVATVRFQNLHLQPFGLDKGDFSPFASASLPFDTEESAVDSVARILQDSCTHFSKLNIRKRVDDDADKTKTENVAETPRAEVKPTKQPAPQFSFPLWDDKGKLCLLGKFAAFFTIDYFSQGGKQTTTEPMPTEVKTKGSCEDSYGKAVLSLSWDPADFGLTMTFKKAKSSDDISAPDTWIVSSIELIYDTADGSKFPGATNPSKITARSMDGVTFFETPLGKSYFCPSPDVIKLYDNNKRQVATVRFQDLHLQSFGLEKGDFSPFQRCGQVGLGGIPEPFAQDETVPIAVGSTLAVLAVLVVIGYAVYRSVLERRVDYSTME